LATTIKYGIPIILAHAIPYPIITTKINIDFVLQGRIKRAAPNKRHPNEPF
jgi:hypothetical protein